jgi:CHAT domain-containing protein
MLLGPVASQLGAKRLLIVADGALQYLPFAALPDPNALDAEPSDRRPLAAGHEIVHLPSASTLAALRREFAGRQPAPKAVAALADPVFAPDDERLKANAMAAKEKERNANAALSRALQGMGDRGAIKRLPFSRQEAEAILRLAPKEAGMMALDFQANRATATSAALRQYRIIHFATHGLLNDEHPELSGIVLTLVDEQGAPQEGFLQLHDIYNLDLPAELVVLSACQTGLGKEIKGEGLVGLTRGFMYAGAPRVVASLWKVSDEATQELMKRFYQGILGEKRLRPAAALREAQIELMKEKRWESPYYWAAFVIQGDWR